MVLASRFCRLVVLCIGGMLLAHGQVWAADKVLDVTTIGQEAVSLTEYFSVLEDTRAVLTFSDVTQSPWRDRFKSGQPPAHALGFSYTSSAIWLRLNLRNSGVQHVARMLDISYALLAQVDFHVPTAQGYRKIEVGYTRSLSADAQPGRFIAVPVQVPAGSDAQIYVRVQTPNSLIVPARLWSVEAFHADQPRDHALQALYFGMALAIAVYNLMLFFSMRDISFLLYVVFVASIVVALGTFTGMGSAFVWGVTPVWTKIGVNVPAALASVLMLMFTRRMLATRDVAPRLDRWLQLFMGINIAWFFLLMFWFAELNRYFVVMNLLTSLLILGVGLFCATHRQRSAYFFVAAFAALFLANALSHLRNLGILPTNVFTSDGLQIGSAMEMLLLSLALADRFNMMRREKIDAQTLALQVQGEMVERLQASEQMLEARVAERTAQLQSLNQQLEHVSVTDGLTGIANRRHFDTVLAHEWRRAARAGQPLTLGMIDLDWFKKYNDHFGHQAGDECLRQVAEALRDKIRRSGDLVARYGGEEFVFIAPETDREQASQLAQIVCQAVRALALAHPLSDFGCVTLSIGVATLVPLSHETPDALLRKADEMLYRAKAQGRNRVVSA